MTFHPLCFLSFLSCSLDNFRVHMRYSFCALLLITAFFTITWCQWTLIMLNILEFVIPLVSWWYSCPRRFCNYNAFEWHFAYVWPLGQTSSSLGEMLYVSKKCPTISWVLRHCLHLDSMQWSICIYWLTGTKCLYKVSESFYVLCFGVRGLLNEAPAWQ